MPRSSIAKRTVTLNGRRSSISLEQAFWDGLKEIAVRRGVSVSKLVTGINFERQHANLSSAVRLFVLGHYQSQLEKRTPRS
jgi:predicted DNA-binding ribbon-helix-helix protein